MKYLHPYRMATVILLFFCFGHTAGGMFGEKKFGAAAEAVFESMKAVHFEAMGADSTFYGWWMGFGLTVSAFLLLSALMSWQLAKVSPSAWPEVSLMAWALFVANVFNAIMAWKYFFLGPQLMSVAICLLLAAGAIMQARRRH